MPANAYIAARVAADTKRRFAQIAHDQGLAESALLKRLIDGLITAAGGPGRPQSDATGPVSLSGRLSIRSRPDDLKLLRDRAKNRGMPTSTYVTYFIRAHLRALTPLPTAELAALKRSIAEVGAIGRNLNQVARAVNRGEAPNGPSRADLQALLRALTGLRDHFKALIATNLAGWKDGYEKARP